MASIPPLLAITREGSFCERWFANLVGKGVDLFLMALYSQLGQLGLLLTALAQTPAPPGSRVDLYTFGPGEDVFSKFGHASLCVFDENGLGGRCFNYGSADFSTPGPLTWDVVRGRARFWVAVTSFGEMLRLYLAEDRTIYRQRLPLKSEQVEEMRQRLETAALPENRYYEYDHFKDNCSTRPRDHIDAVIDGALRRRPTSHGSSFRELIHENLKGDPVVFVLVDTFLGRSIDRERTDYEAMFLPRMLRESVALHLGATPEIVHARHPAPPNPSWLVTHRLGLALGIGLGSALLIVLGTPGASFALRSVFGALFGTVGALLVLLAVVSPLAELRYNELLLVWLPTDFLLIVGSRRVTSLYTNLRLAGLVAVGLLFLFGWLLQPLGPFWALAALVLGATSARTLVRSDGVR